VDRLDLLSLGREVASDSVLDPLDSVDDFFLRVFCGFSWKHTETVIRISLMSNRKITDNVNWVQLREDAHLTLQQLAEISGYSVATINGLELKGEGSKRLKDKLASVLLSRAEEGVSAEVQHWKQRALIAEDKLLGLKAAMSAWMKKI